MVLVKAQAPKVLNKPETSINNDRTNLVRDQEFLSRRGGTSNDSKKVVISSKPQLNIMNMAKQNYFISNENFNAKLKNKIKLKHYDNQDEKLSKDDINDKLNHSKSQNTLKQNLNKKNGDKAVRYITLFLVLISYELI